MVYAMLIRPIKDKTAACGCLIPTRVILIVRMRTAMVTPRA